MPLQVRVHLADAAASQNYALDKDGITSDGNYWDRTSLGDAYHPTTRIAMKPSSKGLLDLNSLMQ